MGKPVLTPEEARLLLWLLARHPEQRAMLLLQARLELGCEPPTVPLAAAVAEWAGTRWQDWVAHSRLEACARCGRLVLVWPNGRVQDWPELELHVCRPEPGVETGEGAAIKAVRRAEETPLRASGEVAL